MRGRLTLEKINAGVTFINRTLRERYIFLKQNPAKLNGEARQRWYAMRETETEETTGRWYVTETDLKNALAGNASNSGFKLDSTGRAVLAILRHLGRIKEVRGGGVIRYVYL